MRRYGMILLAIVLFSAGCSSQHPINKERRIAEEYLQEHGYTVMSHEISLEPYTLLKKDLRKTYNMQIWEVQMITPEDYIGETIYGERFIIKNHPLDHWESGTNKSLGKTEVYLMIVNDQVIGGTSFPVTKENLYGAPYSLDGKTFEELHPNVNWRKWADDWIEKYSNVEASSAENNKLTEDEAIVRVINYHNASRDVESDYDFPLSIKSNEIVSKKIKIGGKYPGDGTLDMSVTIEDKPESFIVTLTENYHYVVNGTKAISYWKYEVSYNGVKLLEEKEDGNLVRLIN